MITIETDISRIINPDGSLATGTILISPNVDFEFTENDDTRKKVTTEPAQVTFAAGILDASFNLAPTLNADQNKTNLYYEVQFITNSRSWTEFWILDADGPAVLEITAVTEVIVDQVASTVDFIPSDDVSVEPVADGIPRARADGTIDPGWILGLPNATVVYRYIVASFEALPTLTSSVLAVGYVTDQNQMYIWAGTSWRVVGG
jgi:hypothetical protein